MEKALYVGEFGAEFTEMRGVVQDIQILQDLHMTGGSYGGGGNIIDGTGKIYSTRTYISGSSINRLRAFILLENGREVASEYPENFSIRKGSNILYRSVTQNGEIIGSSDTNIDTGQRLISFRPKGILQSSYFSIVRFLIFLPIGAILGMICIVILERPIMDAFWPIGGVAATRVGFVAIFSLIAAFVTFILSTVFPGNKLRKRREENEQRIRNYFDFNKRTQEFLAN